jgi:aryl-alcohol dehydrogenase-like predicted oxidoreductase
MTAEPLRLLLGTANLVEDAVTPRLLDQFHDAGGRAIDLGNVYGDGSSERAVGAWLRSRGIDALLFTKGCHPPYCAPEFVASEVEIALTNLGVERLDVFMLHRDDPAVDIRAWGEALLTQAQRGAVGSVGVSNWTVERFLALRECLRDLGDDCAKTFSNHFSLAEMLEPPWPDCLDIDAVGAAGLVASGITVLAWASLAGGYLADGRTDDAVVLRSWDIEHNRLRRAGAAELADELGATTAAISIAYVLTHPGVRPVIGTRSPEHLTEALAGEHLDLTPEQVAYLEAAEAA